MNDCYCTEEYGPCEHHSVTLAQREGASARTADELLAVFVDDAMGCGVELAPWGASVAERYGENLEANRSPWGTAWLSDDAAGQELRDAMETVRSQVETELYTLGLSVFWDDGFSIVRISGGPLSDDDGPEVVERIGTDV